MRRLAVDLGSCTVRLQTRSGRLIEEPSLVAVDTHTQKIVGVGDFAQQMVGRSAPHITQLHPIQEGVVAHHDLATAMFSHLLRQALGWRRFLRPRLIVSVSARSTSIERRALKDAAARAGARRVSLIDAPIAAALGADLDIDSPVGNFVIHVGSVSTEVAVISMGRLLAYDMCSIGGAAFDRAIVGHLERTSGIRIDAATADQLKCRIGTADVTPDDVEMHVVARWSDSGLPRPVMVRAALVREALDAPLAALAECVRGVAEDITPELASDVAERGAVLTGGGALLAGLDRYLTAHTGLTVRVAENAATCALRGAAMAHTRRRMPQEEGAPAA